MRMQVPTEDNSDRNRNVNYKFTVKPTGDNSDRNINKNQ